MESFHIENSNVYKGKYLPEIGKRENFNQNNAIVTLSLFSDATTIHFRDKTTINFPIHLSYSILASRKFHNSPGTKQMLYSNRLTLVLN